MSFHDLAGQQLKVVTQLLEKVRNTLLDVIVSHVTAGRDVSREEDRISQDDVDKLLEEFGL